ncbi:hypothetical protein JKP88DRAFT_251677 [Tribonema minus]|uniref:Phage tail collar domain-containing protein n=1 Tax=Tribonema minus TaxID=303371 RepID=A0A835ZHE3_9STRA|nr:hypothetical protein JKP88DRAFT_251677 [Tribonema minus]
MSAIGDYKFSMRDGDFDRWLKCDGRSLSRVAFPVLFAMLGNTFGAASTSTTFKLPDARGRVIASVSGDHAVGGSSGAETHALSVSEIPSHSHVATIDSAGSHTHSANSAGSHTHSHNATSSTQGIVVSDGANTMVGSDSENPSGTELNLGGARPLTIDSAGSHTHSLDASGAHAHTASIASEGGGSAHSIMQPTLFAGTLFMFGDEATPPLSIQGRVQHADGKRLGAISVHASHGSGTVSEVTWTGDASATDVSECSALDVKDLRCGYYTVTVRDTAGTIASMTFKVRAITHNR